MRPQGSACFFFPEVCGMCPVRNRKWMSASEPAHSSAFFLAYFHADAWWRLLLFPEVGRMCPVRNRKWLSAFKLGTETNNNGLLYMTKCYGLKRGHLYLSGKNNLIQLQMIKMRFLFQLLALARHANVSYPFTVKIRLAGVVGNVVSLF